MEVLSYQVYGSLSDAKTSILESTKCETAKTVEHKYGAQAGNVAKDGLEAVKNITDAAFLGSTTKVLKKVGKKAAIGAGNQMLSGGAEVTSSASYGRALHVNVNPQQYNADPQHIDPPPLDPLANPPEIDLPYDDDGFVVVSMALQHQIEDI